MHPQTFILIGRSGCGKGTQGKLLEDHIKTHDKEKREIYYLETGVHFRNFFKEKSYSADLAKEAYEKDLRQSDFLAVWMWARLFIKDLRGDEHIIADGTCRSLPEAEVFDSALNFYKRKANIIFLNVSRDWSEKHLLKRGREDDKNLDKIKRRLNWFDEETMPAVEFYRKNPNYNFIEVNGENGIEVVHTEIIEKLKIFG